MADGRPGERMKILLMDAQDTADVGPWTGQKWDRIVDLGLGGHATYERWRRRYGCEVTTLSSLRKGFEDFRRVRELMDMGCGQLIDQHGLDWWEIFFLLFHGDLESFVLAQHFCATISPADELHVSRPSLFASILRSLRTAPVVAYALPPRARKNGLGHYARVSRKLSASQMIDVFWDKYDPGYQWRGRLTRKRRAARGPAVLLPTAYINVSRTGVSYAETFPEEKFLLVATRRSGWVRSPPQNVESTWLSQYASLGGRRGENKAMRSQWRSLLRELKQVPEF